MVNTVRNQRCLAAPGPLAALGALTGYPRDTNTERDDSLPTPLSLDMNIHGRRSNLLFRNQKAPR